MIIEQIIIEQIIIEQIIIGQIIIGQITWPPALIVGCALLLRRARLSPLFSNQVVKFYL